MKAAKFIVLTATAIAFAGANGLGYAQMNQNAPENKNAAPARPAGAAAMPAGNMDKAPAEHKAKKKKKHMTHKSSTGTTAAKPKTPGGMNKNAPENK